MLAIHATIQSRSKAIDHGQEKLSTSVSPTTHRAWRQAPEMGLLYIGYWCDAFKYINYGWFVRNSSVFRAWSACLYIWGIDRETLRK